MNDFEIYWYDQYDVVHKSKVYAIDSIRDRFLIAVDEYFKWVDVDDCQIAED